MPRPGPLPKLQVLYLLSSAVVPSGHKSSYSCCSDSKTFMKPLSEYGLAVNTEMEDKMLFREICSKIMH